MAFQWTTCRSRCRETPTHPTNPFAPSFPTQDILIYDEEMDQLKHIPFSQAARACALTNDEWKTICLGSEGAQDEELIKNSYGGTAWADLGKRRPGDTAACITEKLIAAVEDGQLVNMSIVIARPFIEHLMMSCVATVSGRDTGATLFGPAGKSLHHTLPLSLFPLSHIHTLTCVCPLLPRLQTCKSPPTRA